jgi:hypothetical protein
MKHTLCTVALILFGLAVTTFAADTTGVSIRQKPEQLDLLAGNELVASYHTGANLAKPYLWPLNAPGGVTVTRAWPIVKDESAGTNDHPHHKSAWFCHGDIIPVGMDVPKRGGEIEGVDFWSENSAHGRIVCVGIESPARGRVVTRNEWRTSDGRKVLDEIRTISLAEQAGGHLIAVNCELTASVCPLVFGDTKEGSFGVRVSDKLLVKNKDRNRKEIKNPKSVIRNAEGKTTEKGCWGYVSAWCDYSGEIDGKPVGVAVFADPTNKYPTAWHVRDYGLLAANPFGREKSGFPGMKGRTDRAKMEKGERLVMRFGIFTHTGDADSGKVAEAFKAFVAARN